MLRFTTRFARPAVALAAASALAAFAAPAMAATVETAPTVLVRLDAADLSAGTAASTIHSRIASAARKVCGASGVSLHEQMMARRCVDQAVRSAEVQLVAQREQAKSRQQVLASATR